MDAAIALAEHGGLTSLSVEEVTRAAGHAKGTFYVHFADRAELLVAIHRRFHDELFQHIRASTSALPPGPQRARARLIAFLDGCRRQPAVRALLLQARAIPAVAALAEQRNEQAAAELSGDLVAAVSAPRQTAHLLVAATVEVALRELASGRRLPRLRAALVDLVPG
ncbi:MAG: TetR/AcrR family transcriptional regulator [Actinomycetales bacterium]|nr:TetR/AcrR family transcriptional regulator [Actinomycetales bacterium]